MMIIQNIPSQEAVFTTNPEMLRQITQTDKSIAIWQREITFLRKALNNYWIQPRQDLRTSGTEDELRDALTKHFKGLTEGAPLLDDILRLLHLYIGITGATEFRLMLATIKGNMCSRFHTDLNDLRLLCTYVGPGTLWLPDDALDEKALRAGVDNNAIVRDPSMIRQVATGDVALLKGALFPGDHTKPCVHRSPTIEENRQHRLLLRLDTNSWLNVLNQ